MSAHHYRNGQPYDEEDLPLPTRPDPGRPESGPTPQAAYVVGIALMAAGFLMMAAILWIVTEARL